MVKPSLPLVSSARAAVGLAVVLLAGCVSQPPVNVDASFRTEPALAARSPSQIAVLPVEDGTDNHAVARHLTFLRQEVMRQLVDRLFVPITAETVDAAVAVPGGESILTPAVLTGLAGKVQDDAALAIRVNRWDESRLLSERRIRFQFDAAMVAADGTQLWSGTIQGDVKAGGAGPAPLDADAAARSCATLAVRETLLRLPSRIVN
jgi:hypothetical protein